MLNIQYDIYTDWLLPATFPGLPCFYLPLIFTVIMNINRKQENKNGRPGNETNMKLDVQAYTLWHCTNTGVQQIQSRSSHLYVLCWIFCKIESSGLIKGWRWIKVASKLLQSTDQERKAAIWPLTLKIKLSRASEGNDQAIKHTFCWSNILIAVANASTESDYCQGIKVTSKL